MGYAKELLPKMAQYCLAKSGLSKPGKPINLTFSVTNVCQSRCRTCNIWEIYKNAPEKRSEELTLDEIEKIFKSMGHIYIFNVSGGEPFLRPDFVEIIKLACQYLKPGIIHIPTNAIAERQILSQTSKIIDFLRDHSPSTRLTIKPSLDHMDERHDDIRGVPGNFAKVITLFNSLKILKSDFPNLHVELGTVISRWNVNDIESIASFITKLDPESYRNEIAEQRSEMLNTENPITPCPAEYKKAIGFFVSQIRTNMKNKIFFHRITNAFRLEYYSLAIKILNEQKQVIPCYAGISNAHMTPYGDIWACCTLGYEKSMGNLRENGYDFASLWNSQKAADVRKFIQKKNCFCPMANQMYSNILMHPTALTKVVGNIFIKKGQI
ncbi:MAG: radical SAM protein [Proteobacteria bacterium]|nr:radical SAM protein [Pseudomonadota bacterium]MBU4470423.1 radical SAM protein [Pseudomonadota bacterium]MCG2753476.1 radical SAM protein [Desulfobacteraceae bacterium]